MQVAQKVRRCEHSIFTMLSKRVFILEHCFVSKSFAAARESLIVSVAYLYKEIPNKTTVYLLVTKYRDTEVFVCVKCSSSHKTSEITAVQVSTGTPAVTYSCKRPCHDSGG
jgi:hypothetical protein